MESSSNTLELGHSHNQLVTKKRKRFGKGFVAVAVLGLLIIGCLILILYQREQTSQTLQSPTYQRLNKPSSVTLDTVMRGDYEPVRFNGSWISDDEILTKNFDGKVILYNVTSKQSKVLVEDEILVSAASEVTLSADKKYVMLASTMQKMYRHSTYSQYTVIDVETQSRTLVENPKDEPMILSLVKWAPKGNGFAYVYYNNVYYRPNATILDDVQLTKTGNATVYNGICDWVYEEEVFSDSSAVWFSPDGEKLTFATFNDMYVDSMGIPYYGEPASIDVQYPRMFTVRYPKAGRPNPTVKLTVVDLLMAKTKLIGRELTFSYLFPDPILSSVTWITNFDVGVTVMNRVQNKAWFLSCSVTNVPCDRILYVESKTGWLNLFTAPLFSVDGRRMLYIYPWDQGNQTGAYRHVTLHDRNTNVTRPITRGRFTVTDILAWDAEDNYVYFHATREANPRVRHLHRVRVSEDERSPVECLSCENDKECTFATAALSTRNSYFVQTCSGSDLPAISVYDRANKKVLTWEDNEALGTKLRNATLPEKLFVEIPVNTNMNAQVMLFVPPNIDKSGTAKYPLLVNVYGGPDSNQVLERYKVAWETYLCLNREVVIAFIDGRGSGLKGDDMMFANYRRLGTVEIEDQINVTRQLQQRFPFIDEDRSAIWGWSYGGYASGMALTMDTSKVFKCAISVAPVTDWIYYDSVYTERYLGLPTERDNKKGYETSSLVRNSKKLDGKKYLLMHGTMDDNVHYQQSMMLARSLEVNDVLFRQQSYPDEAHSLASVRRHVYHTLESFLDECFV